MTVTGQIIAQSINVQQVTSSIIYSSGSNVFGCDLNSRQTFTGSVLITGSLTIAGASSATSYSGATIYGSTVVCSPVGKFTSCLTFGDWTTAANVLTSNKPNEQGAYIRAAVSIATNPTYAFEDDQDTGMYRDSANSLAFSTNGTNRLTIASTGAASFACSVTAGTQFIGSNTITDPVTATTTASVLALNGPSGNNNFGIGVGAIRNSAYDIWFQTGVANGGGYRFYIGTTEKMTMSSTGNVGIGATSPDATLHICCSAGSANALLAHFQNSGGGTAIATIKIGEGSPEGQYGVLGHYGVDNSFRIGSVNGNLSFHAGASTACGTNLYGMCERLTILTSGDVGIGISAPTALLHLSSCVAGASNSLFIQNSCTTGTGAKIIFAPNSNFGVNDNAAAIASCSTAGGYDVDLVFTTYKSAVGPIERMRIAGGTGAVTTQCQPFVMGGLDGNQCIPVTTFTTLNFSTTTGGFFYANVGSSWNNTTRAFTAPVTGVYIVHLSLYTDVVGQVAMFVNGTRKHSIPSSTLPATWGGSGIIPLTSGDALTLQGYAGSSGTVTQNQYHTWFGIYLLG